MESNKHAIETALRADYKKGLGSNFEKLDLYDTQKIINYQII